MALQPRLPLQPLLRDVRSSMLNFPSNAATELLLRVQEEEVQYGGTLPYKREETIKTMYGR